jgi:hypothetical protein
MPWYYKSNMVDSQADQYPALKKNLRVVKATLKSANKGGE